MGKRCTNIWERIVWLGFVISVDGQTIYGWGFNPDHLIEMYKVTLN